MTPIPSVDLHLRSYGEQREPDRHTFAQLVLPLNGALMLEIEGRQGQLDPLRAGFVAPGAWHSQCGDASSLSLIVDINLDLDLGSVPASGQAIERLHERPFAAIGPAARKLVEFMGIMAQGPAPSVAPSVLQGWVPLLLDTLALDAPRPASRLAALMARVEADPGRPWTTEAMAAQLALSVSRLHALFREELDLSPHAWLQGVRIARAREWLACTDLPIAELALRAGFSEQSALTRAMRKATGLTPAAYRRERREIGSSQE
jgi:AraC-like DNA-binding protein